MKSFSGLEGTWTVTPVLFSDLSWVESTSNALFLKFPLMDLSTRNWANVVKVNLETVVHWESQILICFCVQKGDWGVSYSFSCLTVWWFIMNKQLRYLIKIERFKRKETKQNEEEVSCVRAEFTKKKRVRESRVLRLVHFDWFRHSKVKQK